MHVCTIIYEFASLTQQTIMSDNEVWIWQLFRSKTHLGFKVGWKWSQKYQKSEISLTWCISTINNVKSCKKFNETDQMANYANANAFFSVAKISEVSRVCYMKADILLFLKTWCFFMLSSFKQEWVLLKVESNLRVFFWQSGVVTKKIAFNRTTGRSVNL